LNPKTQLKKYLTFAILVSVLLYTSFEVASRFYNIQISFFLLIFTAAYFISVYTATHHILVKKSKIRHAAFVTNFMAITSIKMLLNILTIVILAFANKSFAVAFIIYFLLYYLIFTAIDVFLLLTFLNKKQES